MNFKELKKENKELQDKLNLANSEALNKYLSGEELLEKENEKYELEFLEILSNLKIYAMKNDKLELLKDVIKEEFNL